jgi:hypothetical protein
MPLLLIRQPAVEGIKVKSHADFKSRTCERGQGTDGITTPQGTAGRGLSYNGKQVQGTESISTPQHAE